MSSSDTWFGQLFIDEGFLLYAGPVAPTAVHAHHAFQLTIALGQDLLLTDGTHESPFQFALIPPDRPHAFVEAAPAALLLYVQPEREWGDRLAFKRAQTTTVSDWLRGGMALVGDWKPEGAPNDWNEAAALVKQLLGPAEVRPKTRHRAVDHALNYIEGALEEGDVRLPAVAEHSGLSASRLSHLFTKQVGIPMRSYVLWRRLVVAGWAIERGEALTTAAHEAGFSDSAHLSRVFRRMFGIPPSVIARGARWVTAPRATR